jgi:hypothetical protein
LAGRLIVLLQLFGNLFTRVLARLPLISLIAASFVGFRKLIRPWMENRFANAAWEREREHESLESKYPEHADDFVDSGSAKRYFERNKEDIIRKLSGEGAAHEEGEYDWYKEWEEWARRQYAQQQQQQQGYGGQYGYGSQQQQQEYQRQYQQQQQKKQKKPPPKYKWEFNPDDPYSVLGIKRGATKKEVSAAFRKEMLKHHPDTQAGASDAAKERATERSKLITDAYRKIKAEMK